MKKPIILCVDDDPLVLAAIDRDLRLRFRKEYRLLKAESAEKALEMVEELSLRAEPVALILSDQRMPGMSGVEFLEQVKSKLPSAKRVLLTAYADTEAAIKAINDAQLHHYLLKPWDPPEDRLYPIFDDLLEDWGMHYRQPFQGIRLIGYQWSPKSHLIKDFLAGNLIPYRWMDFERDSEAGTLLESAGFQSSDLPVVLFEDGTGLGSPTPTDIASRVGLKTQASQAMYDVVIVGAGPSGLAAAVYGASEGLKTLVIDRRAPGGQAGSSPRIENYLGFPSGLSGEELTRRAVTQAMRFGAEFLTPREASYIRVMDIYKFLGLKPEEEIRARTLIISSGVSYRTLDAPGIADLTGAGVYYGSANTEAQACANRPVFVVGGGNSAGQAAMYLSKFAYEVIILVRGESIGESMSKYLADQIGVTSNIRVRTRTEVAEARGEGKLESLVLLDSDTGAREEVNAAGLFIFIGARPCTEWLGPGILKDARGFVRTGRDLLKVPEFSTIWKLPREPYMLETCIPGVFAAGDVRSGSMARVAAAVGEGAMAVKFVHEYLAET